MDIDWGKDLRTIEEDNLMKHFSTPVVVTDYPLEIMAFYKPKDDKDPRTALCFDMLAPEGYGEIIGGSQRSTDIAAMTERLEQMGENVQNYQWYFDLRRFGSVPHSGYGLGVERLVAWICKAGEHQRHDPVPAYPVAVQTITRGWYENTRPCPHLWASARSLVSCEHQAES